MNECLYFLVQTAPIKDVQKEVEGFLSRADIQDLQPAVGQLASALVSRSLADPNFYSSSTLVQLVHTQSLCHRSVSQFWCLNLVCLYIQMCKCFTFTKAVNWSEDFALGIEDFSHLSCHIPFTVCVQTLCSWPWRGKTTFCVSSACSFSLTSQKLLPVPALGPLSGKSDVNCTFPEQTWLNATTGGHKIHTVDPLTSTSVVTLNSSFFVWWDSANNYPVCSWTTVL